METFSPKRTSARRRRAALFEPLTFRRNKFPFTLWHLRAARALSASQPCLFKTRVYYFALGEDKTFASHFTQSAGNLWTRLQNAIKRMLADGKSTRRMQTQTIMVFCFIQLPALFTNRLINITLYCGLVRISRLILKPNGAQSDISQHGTHTTARIQHSLDVCVCVKDLRCCVFYWCAVRAFSKRLMETFIFHPANEILHKMNAKAPTRNSCVYMRKER